MNGAPEKITLRHEALAYALLSGLTQREAATKLGYTESRVSIICSSPLFQALVSDLRSRLRGVTIGGVVDRILKEGEKSVEVIVGIRDGRGGNGEVIDVDHRTRLTAATYLVDKNPHIAAMKREEATPTVKIQFEGDALRLLATAVAEDEGRPVPVAIAAQSIVTSPILHSINETIQRYEDAARENGRE